MVDESVDVCIRLDLNLFLCSILSLSLHSFQAPSWTYSSNSSSNPRNFIPNQHQHSAFVPHNASTPSFRPVVSFQTLGVRPTKTSSSSSKAFDNLVFGDEKDAFLLRRLTSWRFLKSGPSRRGEDSHGFENRWKIGQGMEGAAD